MNNSSLPFSSGMRNPLSEITFEHLPVDLQKAAARAGWSSLVDVQARTIPYLLSGRNMMIQARTGSGKTGVSSCPCWLTSIQPNLPVRH